MHGFERQMCISWMRSSKPVQYWQCLWLPCMMIIKSKRASGYIADKKAGRLWSSIWRSHSNSSSSNEILYNSGQWTSVTWKEETKEDTKKLNYHRNQHWYWPCAYRNQQRRWSVAATRRKTSLGQTGAAQKRDRIDNAKLFQAHSTGHWHTNTISMPK